MNKLIYLAIFYIAITSISKTLASDSGASAYNFDKSAHGTKSETLNNYPQTPSFSCSEKLNPTEKTICDNPRLAVEDRILNEAYTAIKLQLDENKKASLKETLQKFIKTRNNCTTATCISYEYRLMTLSLAESYNQQLKNASKLELPLLAEELHKTFSAETPTQIKSMIEPIFHITSGDEHVCIANTHKIKCWGNNLGGVIRTVDNFSNIQKVVTGSWHQVCALDNGKAKCWGQCDDGQCEINNANIVFTDISSGGTFNCGISNSKVLCWGQNKYHQTAVPPDLLPATKIASSRLFSCALQINGKLGCWGDNEHGQLNLPDIHGEIRKIALGLFHGCILNNEGKITCWGSGQQKSNKHPHYGQAAPPYSEDSFLDISAGKTRTCGLTSKEKIICWGEEDDNQKQIPSSLLGVTQVAVGDHHNCALAMSGVHCWGYRWDEEHKMKFGIEGSTTPITFESKDP